MNSALFAKGNSVIADDAVDLRDKEGYLVSNNAGVPKITDSATVPAFGAVLEGRDDGAGPSSIGLLGAMPPVRLKAGGAIAKYDNIMQKNDGTVVTDVGAGTARVIVGVALEAAAAGDLFLAQTWTPEIRA